MVSLEERLLEQAGIYMKYSVVATTRRRQDFRREKARRRNRLPFGHYPRAKQRRTSDAGRLNFTCRNDLRLFEIVSDGLMLFPINLSSCRKFCENIIGRTDNLRTYLPV